MKFTKYANSLSMKALRGEPVPDDFYYKQIQSFVNQFPWQSLERPSPNVPVDGKMGPALQKALTDLEAIGHETKSATLSSAIENIKSGKLKEGVDELFDAKSEVTKIIREDSEYLKETGQKGWSYQERLQYLNTAVYPIYFPKPWHARNLGSYVSGDPAKSGKFICGPWLPYEKFRTCQTPYYNHFLMWGPDCPPCGVNVSDPRHLKIKRKYPNVFTYENIKKRLDNHMWSPVIPSPGVAPYVVPPPKGSAYYSNPNDPDTETEGVRFFDAEDEAEYYKYLELYNKFKEKEMKSADTIRYQEEFLKQYPHKKLPSRYKPPNEWSKAYYDREKPAWPEGMTREQAKAQGLLQANNKYDSILKLAEKFNKAT